jgi:prolyl-tRNA editing enzyme YbaK/EbsC (Cys-tRNA(Pro) deacylase)
VIKSPRITESEVEAFAGMRNIEEEALRLIGMKRDWMQKYPLMLALAKNPKAPIGVVLPLINRLNLKDLKTLSGDKGVSDAVRQSARRLLSQRKKT